MSTYKQTETKSGDFTDFLPRGRYRARVIGTKKGKSSKDDHVMTTLTCEIIEDATVNGEELQCAGRQFTMFLHHVANETWGQSQVFKLCKRLGIKLPTEDDGMGGETPLYDDDLHKEYFHGMEFDIILSSSEDVKRYEPEQGEKLGKPILDGEGNPISGGFRINLPNINDVPEHCNPVKNEEIAALPY